MSLPAFQEHPKAVLEKCLREVLTARSLKPQDREIALPELSNATVAVIQSERLSGYLIICNASNTFDPDLVEKVYTDVELKMRGYGQYLRSGTDPVILSFDTDVLKELLANCCEFKIVHKNELQTILFSYFEIGHLPKVYDAAKNGFFASDTENNLFPQTKIPFDLHLYFPKNNKILLYLKKHDVLTHETLGKLNKFKVKKIYVKKEEKDLFDTYQTENRILNRVRLTKNRG